MPCRKVSSTPFGQGRGIVWKLALTFAGLALAMLGLFTVFSFWRSPRARPVRRHDEAPSGQGLEPAANR